MLYYSSNLKTRLHICGCDYLPHTTFRLYLINFQLKQISLPNFAFSTVKSPSVTQRSVSQENAFKKRKKPVPFFVELYAQIIFYSNSKQFQVSNWAKVEFKVITYNNLWVKCTQLWPLNCFVLHFNWISSWKIILNMHGM